MTPTIPPRRAPPRKMADADATRALIIRELDVLRRKEEQARNTFKARAYAKVIQQLRNYTGPPIRTMDDVKGIAGIGASIHAKIAEILATGHLEAASAVRRDAELPHKEFWTTIYGIGPVKAAEIAALRPPLETYDDLRRAVAATPSLLNDKQKIGLKYAEDTTLRIPRAEMDQHAERIRAAAAAVSPAFTAEVVGSYRRGAADSGDIDVLLTLPATTTAAERKRLFTALCDHVLADGYVTDTLAKGDKKFLGYCRIGAPGAARAHARRLDLLMTPKEEYAYALLYFTGSDRFNVAMRQKALALGYTLNEHTLTPTRDGVPAVPPMETEQDIFRFLEMTYVAPPQRVVGPPA